MKSEQMIYKNNFGTFCSQFESSQKETKLPRQVVRKPNKENVYHNKRGTHGKYIMDETKRSRHIQKRMNKEPYKKIETPSH